ncbi:MAG: type I 3-dehydroquinate dehydratase [Clostridiales bacterium]|nr:type I 3-dehydroquinate dehydratase [Clostridiales bacterium]
MQNEFDIKGVHFGSGRPVICVPVVESTADGIVEKARELAAKKVQMIEWRTDLFENIGDVEAVRAVLEEIRPLVAETVLLFTLRTKRQGGNADMDEKKVIHLLELAAKSGVADLVDMECFEMSKPEKEIARLQKAGVKVIASHHDFAKTPEDPLMDIIMDRLVKGGADIAKLAVMPQSSGDVIRLLRVTDDTKRKYPGMPLITMSMGGLGVISRIAGESFGSCVSFGADGASSAPGQLPQEVLGEMLDAIHNAVD